MSECVRAWLTSFQSHGVELNEDRLEFIAALLIKYDFLNVSDLEGFAEIEPIEEFENSLTQHETEVIVELSKAKTKVQQKKKDAVTQPTQV